MTVDELREKAMKVIEHDMQRYQHAQDRLDGLESPTNHACNLKDLCENCKNWHHYRSVICGIVNKYYVCQFNVPLAQRPRAESC